MQSNANGSYEGMFKGRLAASPDVPVQNDDVDEGPPNGAWRAARGRPEFGIDFEQTDGTSDGFEYSSLVRRRFTSEQIVLTFLADEMVRVTIAGRGLKQLYELVRAHRCCVVRVSPRDMGQDGEPMISSVKLEVVKAES
jgi:hypothetical protein